MTEVVKARFHADYVEKYVAAVVRRNLRRTELWLSWAVRPVREGKGRLQVGLLEKK